MASLPPLDNSLHTFPQLLDFNEENNGALPWLTFSDPSDASTTHRSITFSEMAQASRRIANVLRPDRQGPEGEIVALILNIDTVHYVAILAGMFRAGIVVSNCVSLQSITNNRNIKPYPMSPRNPAIAVAHMLRSTRCTRVISQASMGSLIDKVKEQLATENIQLHVDEAPSLNDIFSSISKKRRSRPPNPYPSLVSKRDPDDPVLFLHSSGSTGLPKSRAIRERHMLAWLSHSEYYFW